MTIYQFINQYQTICQNYGLDPAVIWQHLEMDDNQALIDELPAEWECFETALKIWKTTNPKWQKTHNIQLPVISCNTCKNYIALSDYCDKHQKHIPLNFDKAKACKRWNE